MTEGNPTNPLEGKALQAIIFSPVDEAMSQLGLTRDDRDNPELNRLSFTLHSENLRRRKALLGELVDTHQGISWDKFKELIIAFGFQVLSAQKFAVVDHRGDVVHPENIIAAHPNKLLLHATSYAWSPNDERINTGEVYATVSRGDKTPNEFVIATSQIRTISQASRAVDERIELDFSVNEGLFTSLQTVERQFPFSDWNNPHRYVDLLGYGGEKDRPNWSDRDARDEMRKASFRRFLVTCPDWVRNFIVGQESYVAVEQPTQYDTQIRAIKARLGNNTFSPGRRFNLRWNLATLLYRRDEPTNRKLPTALLMANPQHLSVSSAKAEAIVDDWLIALDPI